MASGNDEKHQAIEQSAATGDEHARKLVEQRVQFTRPDKEAD